MEGYRVCVRLCVLASVRVRERVRERERGRQTETDTQRAGWGGSDKFTSISSLAKWQRRRMAVMIT